MNIPVLAELGRFPVTIKIVGQVIAYWIHILESDEKSILRQTYSSMLSQDSGSENQWLRFIKQLLTSTGFSHVWQNQGTMQVARLKHALIKKMEDIHTSLWKRKKEENTSKLKFYKHISQNYTLQAYLSQTENFEHRRAMSKLRISAHDLQIERGRYSGTPREERLCKYCDVVEDEIHFLDVCIHYDDLRKELLQDSESVDQTLNYTQKVSSLFTTSQLQARLAKYVFECFQIR